MTRRIVPLLVVGCLASTVLADNTVDVRHVANVRGRNVLVSLEYSPGMVFEATLFAGQLLEEFSNGMGTGTILSGKQLVTFCSEVTEGFAPVAQTYDLVGVPDLPDTDLGPGPMGAARAQEIYDLYAAANGAQFASTNNNTNNNFAAAFQLAMWEIVYDYNGALPNGNLDLSAGLFRYNGNQDVLRTLANGLFTQILAITSPMQGLGGLLNEMWQDQIFVCPDGTCDMTMVPLPTAAGLAGLGLIAVGVRRRR